MVRWVVLVLCATIAGCSTTNNNTEIVEVAPGDAAVRGELATDAGVDAVAVVSEAGDAALGDADDGSAAIPDAACLVSEIPDGWYPSGSCQAQRDPAPQCPACAPYAYVCSTASYPVALAGTGAVILVAGNDTCSNVALCVRASDYDDYCRTDAATTTPNAYGCAQLLDASAAVDPVDGCVSAGFSPFGRCCP